MACGINPWKGYIIEATAHHMRNYPHTVICTVSQWQLPVEVLLQQVQPLLHLSIGEVWVAVLLASRCLLTLGRLPSTLRGTLTRPLLCVELWSDRRQSKWSVEASSFVVNSSLVLPLSPNIHSTGQHICPWYTISPSEGFWGFLQAMAGDETDFLCFFFRINISLLSPPDINPLNGCCSWITGYYKSVTVLPSQRGTESSLT